MRHLSAIVLILLLVTLPSCKYFKGRGLFRKKADVLEVWQAKQDSIRIADSIRRVQDRLMTIENAKLDSASRAVEIPIDLGSKYNIIVGSFITPEYAIGLAEVYRNQGYDSRVINMEGSRFELVSAEAHENFREAVARLKEFQDTIELDAWMYIRK